LANLILRFYDVTGGVIQIDGVDIRNLPLYELRNKIGYVPQQSILFSGTIESNIKYGRLAAGQTEMIKSAETAQAMEFIEALPDQFQAEIAQGGTNVSGGQKQRLAIARALIKKAEIYIFDDSFSALDYRTDAALRKALKSENTESAILVIAQRISSIMHADQIIVLDEGKIAGCGTHRELLKTCEVYLQIALSQLSKEELSL
jgi:ATP-binding cassette subfamily B protein